MLSHELRSPLNPILGWSKLLQTGRLDATKADMALKTIERNAKLQSQLIEDLLDMSRILNGKLALNVEPVNLATTIAAALDTVELATQAKSIQIQSFSEPDLVQVLGDTRRLQQINPNSQGSVQALLVQTQQQTVSLEKSAKQQQLLFDVVSKIHESLDLETIFQETTKGVCQLLQTERVSVYHFDSDWGGKFVGNFEAVSPEWSNSSKFGVGTIWNDTYLQQTQGGRYRHRETFVVDNIYQMGFADCHIELLEQFQIQAFAITPIFARQKLWGLLAAYQHSQPHHWNRSDIQFLIQTAAQLGIALQQAELLGQIRQQAIDLQKVVTDLNTSEEQKQFLFRIVHKMRQSLEISKM